MSRGGLGMLAILAVAIAQAPDARAATRVDLTVSGLWIESLAYSAIPLSGTAGGGLALNVYPASALSVELAAAVPTDIGLATELASIRLRAYTLTAKYHVLPHSRFSPYLGFGAYHSLQSLDAKYQVVRIEGSSTGWAAQAGLDCRIGSHFFANLDLRYLGGVGSNDLLLESRPVPLAINPLIIGLGVGYRTN